MTTATQTTLDGARRMSHGEQLARAARRFPDVEAFVFEDERRTFAELDGRVDRLAHALERRGIRRGDRVATLMTNRLEVVETYLAVCRLGAICVPINFRLVASEIAYVAEHSGAKVLVVDAGLAAIAADARAALPELRHVLVVAPDSSAAGPGAERYEDALAACEPAPLGIDVDEAEPAFIMYTSGTTGRPKGAVLTHFNLFANTMNMFLAMDIRSDDRRWLSGLPLFHIGGLNGILPYLLVGGTSVILPSGQFDAARVVDTLEAQRITSCYFVPTQWQAICAVPGISERRLALRRISWGASVAPPSVLQAMAATFPGVGNFNAFGQTEMSSVTCVLRGEDAIRKMGSVGTPVPNVEVRLVDDDERDVARGEVGEIVYRGPTVMRGYWNAPDATDEAFRGGWFHSGDLVRQDPDGFYYVVDRKKDMIVSGGENIYCAEVEAAIDAHPAVREVAIVGVPHAVWVETPLAVVAAVDPAAPPSEAEVIEWCRGRLASYKKPTRVMFVDALPRNAAGKVLKRSLREQYAGTAR